MRRTIQVVLTNLIQQLVDQPDVAYVNVTKAEQTTVFEVIVAKSDRGKVIGKNGMMIQCLRHILYSMASKNKIRAILEICEETGFQKHAEL